MLINTSPAYPSQLTNQAYFRLYNLIAKSYIALYSFDTLLHIIFTILFFLKFKSFNKIVRFIGKSRPRNRKRKKHWTRRFKTKVPYFYLKSSRKNKITMTYTNIKLYKLFWYNNDIFQISNLDFIKRYAVFGKRPRMLKNILRRIIKKSQKKNYLKKFKYANFNNIKSFKRNYNINSLLGLFGGVANKLSKSRKLRKMVRRGSMRAVNFKKIFFKALIDGRGLTKLILNKKHKSKRSFTNIVSASTHTTFFKRINDLELSLFNLVLRSRFTTSIKDAFKWVKLGMVFVNNKPTFNPYRPLVLGDRIQLTINNSYYFYKKTHSNKNKKDVAKLKSKLWLKNKGKFNLFRKRSKVWPKWILRTIYYKTLIPNFLEVDFLSLTSVIVYLPKIIAEYDSVLWRYINIYNFRLYNWRVIN